MTSSIKYLVLSDIHLGKRAHNTTKEIITNLDIYFNQYTIESQFKDLDMLFIAGDLFDGLLELSSEDIAEITMWIDRLMNFCARNAIKLRILEGTPSHDWKQSKLSESIYEIKSQDPSFILDFKYIDVLHIESLSDLQLHILYVPDEWSTSALATQKQVEALLKAHQLNQVDIAIMHGMFPHQLPSMIQSNQKHDVAFYLSIVKRFINIGHIHTFSVLERILAQGSFDRLSHGEEEAKGGILVELSDSEDIFTFIENKFSKTFLTIELHRKDTDSSLSKIDKLTRKLRDDSNIRIKAAKDHPLLIAFDELKLKFPRFNLSKKILDEEEDYLLVNQNLQIEDVYIPITLTKDNIVDLTLKEITQQEDLRVDQVTYLTQMLTDLV